MTRAHSADWRNRKSIKKKKKNRKRERERVQIGWLRYEPFDVYEKTVVRNRIPDAARHRPPPLLAACPAPIQETDFPRTSSVVCCLFDGDNPAIDRVTRATTTGETLFSTPFSRKPVFGRRPSRSNGDCGRVKGIFVGFCGFYFSNYLREIFRASPCTGMPHGRLRLKRTIFILLLTVARAIGIDKRLVGSGASLSPNDWSSHDNDEMGRFKRIFVGFCGFFFSNYLPKIYWASAYIRRRRVLETYIFYFTPFSLGPGTSLSDGHRLRASRKLR